MTNTFHQPHSLPAQPICQMGPQGVPQGLQAMGPSGPGGAGPTSLQGHVLHHHQDHVQVWSLFSQLVAVPLNSKHFGYLE